jgi:hypothetical protein
MSAPDMSATQLALAEFEGILCLIYLHWFVSASSRVGRSNAGQKWNGTLESTLGSRCLISTSIVVLCM